MSCDSEPGQVEFQGLLVSSGVLGGMHDSQCVWLLRIDGEYSRATGDATVLHTPGVQRCPSRLVQSRLRKNSTAPPTVILPPNSVGRAPGSSQAGPGARRDASSLTLANPLHSRNKPPVAAAVCLKGVPRSSVEADWQQLAKQW